MKRGGFIKRKNPWLKSHTHHTTLWEVFSEKCAVADRDQDGLLHCEWLEGCSVAAPRLDAHHTIGKATRPDLYFEKTNITWLCRDHHEEVHRGAHNTGATIQQGEQSQDRKVRQPTSFHQIRQGARLRRASVVATQDSAKGSQDLHRSGVRRDNDLLSRSQAGSGPVPDSGHHAEG